MKKIVLIGLLVSAAMILAAGYLLPRRYELQKATNVAAPASYLFEEVINLERWPLWVYWFDENSEIAYGDTRVGNQAQCTWKNRNGTGKAKILIYYPNQMVRVDLDFGERGSVNYEFRFVPDTLAINMTRLILTARVVNPPDDGIWNRWKRFLLANRLAPSLPHNLTSLRRIAETKPIFDNVTEELLAPTYYVSVRRKRNPDSAVQQVRALHAQILDALKSVGSNAAGPPFCLLDDSVVELGVPVHPDARVPNSYNVIQLYSGPVVRGSDSTSYSDIERTHNEVLRYIQYKDYVISGTPWEVYITSPNEDPSTWITEVYYPIATRQDQELL
ncbi:MAG TPA: hypothetical protein VIL31_07270 [Cyclobacteriaceae bacterium]|jgi:hypothetical protein